MIFILGVVLTVSLLCIIYFFPYRVLGLFGLILAIPSGNNIWSDMNITFFFCGVILMIISAFGLYKEYKNP